MNPAESIFAALGGAAILVTAAAWLARSLIGQFLSKDLERFKSELSSATAASVERTKHELQLAAQERNLLLTKLHEKRASVIAELYGLLVEAHWAAQDFASPMERAGEPNKSEKYATALNKAADFYRFFDKNRIYLPKDLCSNLEEFLKAMRNEVIGFGVYLTREEEHMSESAIVKKHNAWGNASTYFDKVAPKTRDLLEAELRRLIGVVERESSS